MPLDRNLFYDNQLCQNETSWDLIAQPWTNPQTETQEGSYSEIILSGIIQETEFGINISHEFGLPDGVVGELGSKFKSILDPLESAGRTMSLTEGALRDLGYGDLYNSTKAAAKSTLSKTKFGTILWKAVDNISKGSVFHSAFDHVKVYKGSTHNFELQQLSTRVWHDTAKVDDKGNTMGSWEYMQRLMKRFVGGLESVESHFDTVLGIQNPPNGYVPSFRNIKDDTPIKGTFQLRYGNHWINNLLVTQVGIRASTFRVRGSNKTQKKEILANIMSDGSQRKVKRNLPSGEPKVSDQDCLYIDVSVQLLPCTYISDQSLLKALQMR